MDKNELIVRIADQGDLDLINQQHALPHKEILRKISNEEIFLLFLNGVPAGQLRVAFLWSIIPYIELIYVDSNFRKQGYGQMLLGYLEAHLRTQGYQDLYSSSQVDEPEPQAWHRHMGFEECGIINGLNEGGIGEVFFKKVL